MIEVKEEKDLGLTLKLERVKKRLSQRELAKRIGCAHTTISEWERNNKAPSYKYLTLLQDLFGRRF